MTVHPELLQSAAAVRHACRKGHWCGPTAGLALGFVQANVVILPRSHAFDFLLFCLRNPRPCPLLEVVESGSEPKQSAPNADLRTDLPKYHIFRGGELSNKVADLSDHWNPDWVSFLLGCSFTFEKALLDAGLPVRHLEEGRNVPMYRTNLACATVGPFRGNQVVSMRPMTPAQAEIAARICAAFPQAHGAPLHQGDPNEIGICDLSRPDYGDAVTLKPGEIPVFWACGVTPQNVLREAKLPMAITHAPGHMFVTDLRA